MYNLEYRLYIFNKYNWIGEFGFFLEYNYFSGGECQQILPKRNFIFNQNKSMWKFCKIIFLWKKIKEINKIWDTYGKN